MGSLLVVLGCLLALGISGLYSAYLLTPGQKSTLELGIAVVMAAVALGAVVVLVRLYRYQPVGWLAAFVLLVGLGLPALLFLPFLFGGVPFIY